MDPTEMEKMQARAIKFWETIDVDKLQPIIHGEPMSADELIRRTNQLMEVNEIAKKNNIETKETILFPDLEPLQNQ